MQWHFSVSPINIYSFIRTRQRLTLLPAGLQVDPRKTFMYDMIWMTDIHELIRMDWTGDMTGWDDSVGNPVVYFTRITFSFASSDSITHFNSLLIGLCGMKQEIRKQRRQMEMDDGFL